MEDFSPAPGTADRDSHAVHAAPSSAASARDTLQRPKSAAPETLPPDAHAVHAEPSVLGEDTRVEDASRAEAAVVGTQTTADAVVERRSSEDHARASGGSKGAADALLEEGSNLADMMVADDDPAAERYEWFSPLCLGICHTSLLGASV